MIKIQGLFAHQWRERQIAVQTDSLLPKIMSFGRKKYMQPLHENKSMVTNSTRHCNLKKLNSDSDAKIDKSSLAALLSQNSQVKLSQCMKQKTIFSTQIPKIQAKKFKFLQFQQNILRQTLQKYLVGKPLSKEQLKKLHQQIHIIFVNQKNHNIQNDDLIIIEMPEPIIKKKKIKQIVNEMKQIYMQHQNIGLINRLSETGRRKRLVQIIQSLVLNKKSLQIDSDEKSSDSALKCYLQKYIQSFQQNQPVKIDEKESLLNFYTQVFNRYDEIPFCQEFNNPSLNLSRITPNSMKSKTMIIQKNGKQKQYKNGKDAQKGFDSQFIKLKFYDNLRNQVKNMADDTEKILSEEMNKLTQI